jgi:hypothetical protein
MFTDGLVERRGVSVEIGIAHLMIQAEQTSAVPVDQACEAVLSDTPFASQEDDICLLIADFFGGLSGPVR